MQLETSLLHAFILTYIVDVIYAGFQLATPSQECTYNGYLTEEGLCSCYGGYTGLDCSRLDKYGRMCQANEGDKALCSDRGECIQGSCVCSVRRANNAQRYSGQFCECDDFSCPWYRGRLCGGPSTGSCECGKCYCRRGYTGDNCGCSTSTENCKSEDGNLCNNRGTCVCGMCSCEGSYHGPTCEYHPSSPTFCEEYRSCVQCRLFDTGVNKSICHTEPECTNLIIRSDQDIPLGEGLCEFVDETDSCRFFFIHFYDKFNRLNIKAKGNKVCSDTLTSLLQKRNQGDDPSASVYTTGNVQENNKNNDKSGAPSAIPIVTLFAITCSVLLHTVL